MADGVQVSPENPTVQEWLEHWLAHIAPVRLRPRTLESYMSAVRLHISPQIGHVRLQSLEPEQIERLYAALLAQGLSSSTVARIHQILARAVRVAAQRGRVDRNVVRLIDTPRIAPADVARPLTLPELHSVLLVASKQDGGARWLLGLALGLRQSEILGLRWVDVDLDRRTLTVRRTQHRVTGIGITYEPPKTRRSHRTLTLPHQVHEALTLHKAMQIAASWRDGAAWQDANLIFARQGGLPLDRRTDYGAWCRLLREAGVRHIRLHDARHTTATLLLSEGVNPREIMELLGHARLTTTLDTYSHMMPTLAKEAASRMEQLLSPSTGSQRPD